MSPDRPDDTRTDSDFAAAWSSDAVTRSFTSGSGGIPADLPFLFAALQQFGPYQIVRPIGKGGMGQVYEAEETDSGRRVAIKILSRGIGDDEERERFLQEGRLAASLSHPNTVYVFGTTEIQGFLVIAMELAPSGTLKDLVQADEAVPPAAAVDAMLQVIAGLEAAASIGILHRDVKPSNCFVAADGRVLVGDFGLSIAAAQGHGERKTILGTPGFASPEQLRGDALDLRSDIYAVGATLFYLLAGRPPFEDRSTTGLIDKVGSEPAPSIAALRPDVPRRLSQIVAQCLAKDPAARFADYAALHAALEPFSTASQPSAPLVRRATAGAIDAWLTGIPAGALTPLLGLFPLSLSHRGDALIVSAITVATIVTYYGLLEGRWGAGVGKALMGLRVVDRAQATPGIRRAIERALAFALPSQAVALSVTWLVIGRVPEIAAGVLDTTTGALSLAVLFCTARRSNGYLGLHDRITGTRVVRRRLRREARDRLPGIRRSEPAPADGGTLIGPYRIPSEAELPVVSPRTVVGYDDRLRRRIRLDLLPAGAAPLDAARRDLDRTARSRWLGGRRGEQSWDAYEALEGVPLEQAAGVPHPWSRVRHWLEDLTAEVIAGRADGTLPPLDPGLVLVGSDGRARLLDPPQPAPDVAGDADLASAQRFLYSVTASALLGVPPAAAAERKPDTPLPMAARKALLALRSAAFGTAGELRDAVHAAVAAPAVLSRARRGVQLAASAALPILVTVASMGSILALNRQTFDDGQIMALQTCLNVIEEGEKASRRSNPGAIEDKTDAEVYIAERLAARVRDPNTWARSFPGLAQHGGRDRAYRALDAHRVRTAEEIRHADARVDALIARQRSGFARLATWSGLWSTGLAIVAGTAVVPALIALLGAVITGCGFTFRPCGAALVTRRGEPISRLRAVWRAAVSWSLIAAILVSFAFRRDGSTPAVALIVGQMALLASTIAAALWSIARPSRIEDDVDRARAFASAGPTRLPRAAADLDGLSTRLPGSLAFHQLDAPIARASFERGVRILRARRAVAGRLEPLRLDLVVRDERLLDRCRAPFGQIEIVGVAADVVRVPLDGERPRRMLLHHLRDVGEHRLRLGLEPIAREIEVDAVDDGAAFVAELALDACGAVGGGGCGGLCAVAGRRLRGCRCGGGGRERDLHRLQVLVVADRPLQRQRVGGIVEEPELRRVIADPSTGVNRRQLRGFVVDDHLEPDGFTLDPRDRAGVHVEIVAALADVFRIAAEQTANQIADRAGESGTRDRQLGLTGRFQLLEQHPRDAERGRSGIFVGLSRTDLEIRVVLTRRVEVFANDNPRARAVDLLLRVRILVAAGAPEGL
jgi:uncharacterized RDD family membrane protein YckC